MMRMRPRVGSDPPDAISVLVHEDGIEWPISRCVGPLPAAECDLTHTEVVRLEFWTPTEAADVQGSFVPVSADGRRGRALDLTVATERNRPLDPPVPKDVMDSLESGTGSRFRVEPDIEVDMAEFNLNSARVLRGGVVEARHRESGEWCRVGLLASDDKIIN